MFGIYCTLWPIAVGTISSITRGDLFTVETNLFTVEIILFTVSSNIFTVEKISPADFEVLTVEKDLILGGKNLCLVDGVFIPVEPMLNPVGESLFPVTAVSYPFLPKIKKRSKCAFDRNPPPAPSPSRRLRFLFLHHNPAIHMEGCAIYIFRFIGGKE